MKKEIFNLEEILERVEVEKLNFKNYNTDKVEFNNLSGNNYPSTKFYLEKKLGKEKKKFTKYSTFFFILEEILEENKKLKLKEIKILLDNLNSNKIKNTSLISKLKEIRENGLASNLITNKNKGYKFFIKELENYTLISNPNKSSISKEVILIRN